MREHRALNQILEPGGITPVYQPICLAAGDEMRLVGFECLSRGPKGTNFESANVLFEYVRLKREETLVDRACISAALLNAPNHDSVRLSVNVHASTLGRDHEFVNFLSDTASRAGIPCTRLTVEIVEHAPPWDGISFAEALESLRAKGIRIALDDVGLGQSNFKMMLDVCPDYLKIDKYFVELCDSDRHRQAVIEALVRLGSHFGADIVAEGVERIEVRDALWRYGVRLMQGYLYGAPMSIDDASRLVRGEREARTALPLSVV
jgi:EAL domain-containing protein (putative c-di-GMP-specific phosphodiesterase class I)